MITFVDTSAWLAAFHSPDHHHDSAAAILGAIDRPVLSSLVLAECWRLMRDQLGFAVAETFWDGLRDWTLRVEPVLIGDLEVARRIGAEFSDQEFSLVDRTSFAVMERLRITQVATFDTDFAVYRHGRNKERSFAVLR